MKTNTPKNIRKLKAAGIWIVLMFIFMTELLFYTWSRVQCVQLGYEISKETDNIQDLTAVQNSLKIEIARLKSPERIEKIAKNRFDLSTPRPEQVIMIHEAS